MTALYNKIKPFFDVAYNVVVFICKIMLILEVVFAVIMVGGRFIFSAQPAWCSEMILTFMVYMSLISAALALRRNAHIRMDVFDRYLPKKLLLVLDLMADVAIFAFSIMMITQGTIYAMSVKGFYSALAWLSRKALFAAVPDSGVCIFVFEFENVVKHQAQLLEKEEAV